jgi:hypothetical protein
MEKMYKLIGFSLWDHKAIARRRECQKKITISLGERRLKNRNERWLNAYYRPWLTQPDFRLGQFIACCVPAHELFSMEDLDLVERIERFSSRVM